MGRIAQEWENEMQGGGGGTQNQGRGRGRMAIGNLILSVVGSGGGGRRYVHCELPQKEDGEAGTMGKGGGVMDDEMQGGGGGMQNQRRGTGGMAMGNLVLSVIGIGSGGGNRFVASHG